MRIPSSYRVRRTAVDIQMTPMIDMVFLLIVYFIWSASFVVPEQMLGTTLAPLVGSGAPPPDAPPLPEQDFDDVVVRIRQQNGFPAWDVNGAPVASLRQLQGLLARIAGVKRDAPVVLHPEPDVPLGDVIDAFDLARLAGFDKIRFAAAPP